MVGYYCFLDVIGCLFRNEGNMVRFKDWGYGKNCILFEFLNVVNGRYDDFILFFRNEVIINIYLKCVF